MQTKDRLILLLLGAINFTHIMDFMIMMPLGNYLMPHFGINAQAFSILVSGYSIAAFVSSLLAAFVADRYDRKQMLLFGYTGFIIGTACCAMAPSFGFLLIARIGAGLFGGLISAQVLSIVADRIPYEHRATAMGIVMGAFAVASALGVPAGLYMATHFNWHAPFYAVAGMGAVLIPLTMYFLPAMRAHLSNITKRVPPLDILKGIFTDRNQRMALALSATLMFGHFIIVPFLNPFMEYNMGFSKDQSMLVYVVGGVATFFTSPILGRLADKSGKFRMYTIMVALAMAPVLFITHMPLMPLVPVLCVTGFWFIVSTGRSIPAQAMISQVVPPKRRGGFMSINGSFQQLATGIASLLAGVVVSKEPAGKVLHYGITGFISAAVLLGSIWLAYRLHKALAKGEAAAAVENIKPPAAEELAV